MLRFHRYQPHGHPRMADPAEAIALESGAICLFLLSALRQDDLASAALQSSEAYDMPGRSISCFLDCSA
jgi:hypothetical protein